MIVRSPLPTSVHACLPSVPEIQSIKLQIIHYFVEYKEKTRYISTLFFFSKKIQDPFNVKSFKLIVC